MKKGEVSFRIGGAAGDGVASSAETFSRACTRSGLFVSTYSFYQSIIRGGHVWTQVRASESPVSCHGEDPDVLICLNQDTADLHAKNVTEGGAIIVDSNAVKVEKNELKKGVTLVEIPLLELSRTYSTAQIMKNTVALGAAVGLLDMDFDIFVSVVKSQFGAKKQDVIDANVGAAKAGHDFVAKGKGSFQHSVRYTKQRRMLVTGNEAIAMGALASGVKFHAQYPMTPSSSILHYLAAHGPKNGVVVKQSEDELASINMAIGAGLGGVRAMTATSGGGFSLMVEGLGLAGMLEVPVVVVLAQRGGPSTGLPTKTEQGDLNLAMGAGQGDWPRAIIAPRNQQECFDTTVKAFNLADVYQTPIILMTDLVLSESYGTVSTFDFNVPINRGMIADESKPEEFKRYLVTDSGVSPRAFPGQKGFEHIAGSDEHLEDGTLISDVLAGMPDSLKGRVKMHDKRMRKLEGIIKDTPGPELWGPERADLTLVSWGATQGALREAISRVNAENRVKVNSLEYCYVFPFHSDETKKILKSASSTMAVEGNHTGQFARLLRAETSIEMNHHLRKYDGEPFEPRHIVSKIKEVMKLA
jgi:2-oxoglutarate ferredoxin oxidoreductase subunit alpha